MAMQTQSELELFHQFVGERLAGGRADDSVDAALEEFRQLAELRAKLDVARKQCERGECRPLDVEETIQAVRKRLAEHGVHGSP
jgi:hypothetical protein